MEPISLLVTILIAVIILGIVWYVVKMMGFSAMIQNIIMLVLLLIFIIYLFRPIGLGL